jgi:hypothetical protein
LSIDPEACRASAAGFLPREGVDAASGTQREAAGLVGHLSNGLLLVVFGHERHAGDTPVAVNPPPSLAVVDDPVGSAR